MILQQNNNSQELLEPSCYHLEDSTALWGCTPQVYKAHTFTASKPKSKFGVSNRDTSGLMDGGVYRSEASFWRDTPLCAVDSGQDVVAGFAPELDF